MDKSSGKFKAWIVDFDGTIANARFNISSEIKEAITKLVGDGYIFVIATGRPYQGIIKDVCKSLKLSAPQITSGGAQIFDPQTDSLLWAEYILTETAKAAVDFFLDNNYSFSIENENYVCTTGGVAIQGYGPGVSFKDLKQIDYETVSKMVLEISDDNDPQEMAEKLNSLYPDLHIVRSGVHRTVLDITSEKATKHLAVLELSKILKIDPSLMIGVGDGYNDYPLLSVCGFKVALENAPTQLKEIADLIVPNVEKNGLVVAINKLNL